jgi:hypothetical protein
MVDGSGVKVTSRSPSELKEKPREAGRHAVARAPAYDGEAVGGVAHVHGELDLGQVGPELKPGPMKPSAMSTVSFSTVPAVPFTVMKSVFVVVAPPQGRESRMGSSRACVGRPGL